jgi:hypothetical protein
VLSVRTAKSELPVLKPLGFGTASVVAKATTHKDSRGLTLILKPWLKSLCGNS